ncbi:hypothetical protein [Halobacillus massiliensis]|uniref:hypothetical protein n=1 Tax=Halobacillus massiliensis TaxID=1926286 RepID=UPI0009E39824|nr:hypothetical protein [Halobacillus massiliensis]
MSWIFRNLVFCFLFIGALYATWYQLSNMTISDVIEWMDAKEQQELSLKEPILAASFCIFNEW